VDLMAKELTYDSSILIPLEERAENIQPSIIRQMGSIDERIIFKVSDYSTGSLKHPLFMMGPKGYGKTFAVLKALNRLIREFPKWLPVMFVYKKSKVFELLPPTFIAEPESWGERLSLFDSDIKTLVERADLLVMDDIHYRCEAIMDGEASLTIFIEDLKLILELVENGKKVLLVSEEPLAYYGDLIQDEELDEILAQYGQTPYRRLVGRNKIRTQMVISSFEVLPIEYENWSNLFMTYGFEAEDAVRQIIYNISDRPRFFIRMMQLFWENRAASVPITIEDLVRVAIERGVKPYALVEPIVRTSGPLRRGISMEYMKKVNKKLYLAITNSPFYSIKPSYFGEDYSGKEDTLRFIGKHYELVETICRHVRNRIGMPPLLKPRQKTLWSDPFYAMRILEAEDPGAVSEALQAALDIYDPKIYRKEPIEIVTKRRAIIMTLTKFCYRTPVMSYFRLCDYQRGYEKIPETKTKSWKYWKLINPRSHRRNYIRHSHLDNIYLLTRPFEKAFQDLTEKHQLLPTLKKHDYRGRGRLFTDEQLIELHEQGLNDREIGEKLGSNRVTVGIHRRRLGLEVQRPRRRFTDEQFIELYERGLNDREISEELGVSNTTVYKRRRRLGLKTQPRKHRHLFTDEQLIELYEQGLKSREIAEKLGVAQSTVSVHRKRLGLKPY